MTRPEAAAAPPRRREEPDCRFCGASLTPPRAARGICDAASCGARSAQEAARATFRRDWPSHVAAQRLGVERAANGIAAAVRLLGRAPDEIAFGVVPRHDGPVLPLPEERRAAFAAHLGAITAGAFAEEEPAVDLARREACERAEEPLLDAACATCQGKCCVLGGGTHAFLTVETIRLYRERHPESGAAEIVAHYLARLPAASVEHSCVYHGAHGCVLPRRERADVCNRYHCNPQADLLRRHRELSAGAAVIVADDGETEPAVAVFDAAGWQRVESDPQIPPDQVRRVVAAALARMPADVEGEEPAGVPVIAAAECGSDGG